MQFSRATVAIAALSMLAACGSKTENGDRPAAAPPPPKQRADWHYIVTPTDRDRLSRWRTAWIAGLDKAAASGKGAQIAAQGELLKPDFALDDPMMPAGDYRCRVIKLGAQTKGLLDYVAYPFFTCRISTEEGRLGFVKIDGSQRPVGGLYPDEGRRMIFLGAMMLGDEARPLPYGRDGERDMAGIVERIGPNRWRIIFPYPRWESTIDVVELIPKG